MHADDRANLSEPKNISEHLLTDNELFFLICLGLLFSLHNPFVIVCFELFQREIHGMVPGAFLQINNVTFVWLSEMGMGMG